MLSIRTATLQDLNQLVALEKECFTVDILQRQHYRRFLQKNSAMILLAEYEGKIVGNLILLFRKNSSQARLYSLAVSPSQRQLGIAKKLCAEMEKHILQRNCSTIILEVRQDNIAAIQFYEKNGYEIFGSYPKFYEDGMDALRMKKIL